jgi:hypothetical protein
MKLHLRTSPFRIAALRLLRQGMPGPDPLKTSTTSSS